MEFYVHMLIVLQFISTVSPILTAYEQTLCTLYLQDEQTLCTLYLQDYVCKESNTFFN